MGNEGIGKGREEKERNRYHFRVFRLNKKLERGPFTEMEEK